MRVAVIDSTGAVVNVIIADPERDHVPGCTLVAIPDGVTVDQRWVWSEAEGFKPRPELQAEIDRQIAEVEAEAYDLGGDDDPV